MERKYPKRCPECAGPVSLVAKPGRYCAGFPLPPELQIPTCEKCGEEYWDEGLMDALELLMREYQGANDGL